MAVNEWLAAVRVEVVTDQVPADAVPDPTALPSEYTVTVAPASAVPVMVGVVTRVMLSVFEIPVSEAAIRSGVDGAAGPVVSMTTQPDAGEVVTWPTLSVAVMIQ